MTREWPRIAVVGAGAVGGYFGGTMALAGAPIVMIGRKQFADAVNQNGLLLDKGELEQRVNVKATTDMAALRDTELVLFCVKTVNNKSAATEMARFLAPEATVVSLQNGVDNVEQIESITHVRAVPAAVYVAVSVPEPGRVKHLARGDLIIGPKSEQTEKLAKIFNRAGVPCRVTGNIEGELWIKLLCNCALNAISALGHARYGQLAESTDARELMEAIVREVLSVAQAANVVLPNINDARSGIAAAIQIATQMPGALSSTAQDLERCRATEIDSLNGYIVRRGAELGVKVPVNHALATLVKLAEKNLS
jgi:2-dehydropantoate 2-reductase